MSGVTNVKVNKVDFESILLLAASEEQRRLERLSLNLRLDEYKLVEKAKIATKKNDYQFPRINEVKADKCILTRSQNVFSAKIHHPMSLPYFHKHDFVELIYVYKGKCRQYLGSFEHTLLLLQGDIFLLNPNVVHAIQKCSADDIIIQMIIPQSYISYQFIDHLRYNQMLFDFFFNARAERNEYYHYIVFRNCYSEEVKCYVENIMTEYYSRSSLYEEAVQSYLRLMMIELSRNVGSVESVKHKMVQSSIEISEIIKYIYLHSADITLEELSNVFSFNMSYLSRVIHETSRNTFQELLKEFRMEKAEHLLRNSDLSIEQIARQVGYKNASPIYKGIRERHGVTPIQYRIFYQLVYNLNTGYD